MQVINTTIPEVLIFEPKVFGDNRGYFMESFRQKVIEEHIGQVNFVQDNESFSQYGVLRGLHFQRPPHTQGKLVRVLQGEVLDVAVDIRLNSPTYGQHVPVRLSADNKRQLWIPRGFAHGFAVLSPTALFSYKCDNYYAPEFDGGLMWNDPAIGIDWQIPDKDIQLSEKDTQHPLIKDISDFEYAVFSRENVYR
ncbi:dTDP-4-dehydrorhamnose 3,5-epimerase [Draconibacterium orientale]|uniref:dTDP-4-dehydrorhamnose 3,5-epimerase n=1 Tax=Draconibacterium orientale TaxID=1168034 RepID=X5DJM7_9BACT|nr:dTDP-4-dehydrorhamnose 3,5-epimerase [Draconibacterium orientale]AHW61329.1 dTDP-4-dehydrorhamnose 3,5-epimerase [Draconibacterium orientale]SEU05844.1 dTDP-4-dehydrorhamnose 3,5-epimerase [Draconibacterium orientale]